MKTGQQLQLLLLLPTASLAFHPSSLVVGQYRHEVDTRSSRLEASGHWFFENPFHGGGSAKKEELDDIWETQQAILKARQGHDTKDMLKAKYKNTDIKFQVHAISNPEKQHLQNMDATYSSDNPPKKKNAGTSSPKTKTNEKAAAGFKMPWDK